MVLPGDGMLLEVDETDPMNGHFSGSEFSAALGSCNVSSLGSWVGWCRIRSASGHVGTG